MTIIILIFILEVLVKTIFFFIIRMNEEIYFISFAIIHILLNIIILIFSSIILLTIIINWHRHFHSVSNLLICNSSLSFFLYSLSILFQIPSMFSNNNLTLCRLRAFLTTFTASSQIFSYLSQAIYRYFSTNYYKKRILLTYRVNIPIILIGWLIPLITNSCMFLSSNAFQYESESRICFLTTKYFFSSAFIGISNFFIPLSTIILLYTLILRNITYRHKFQSNFINKIRYKRNLKVFHHILLNVGIILICGIPFVLSIIINLISQSPWIFYSLIILFITISITLESIILFLITNKVKQIFYRKIKRKQIRKKNHIILIDNQFKYKHEKQFIY